VDVEVHRDVGLPLVLARLARIHSRAFLVDLLRFEGDLHVDIGWRRCLDARGEEGAGEDRETIHVGLC
jgi:hypothetical protein